MHRPMRTTRRLANLQGQPGWYRIRNTAAAVGGPARVDIYDEIGFLAVSADSFIRDLAAVDGDIEMHLNCPGGDVFDGIAIYNNLKQRSGTVSVVVDGLAASAASFIAQAASPGKLAMAPHSQMMVHDAFGMGIGNAADMRELAGLLDKASDNIAGIYADRSGKPAAYWRELMRGESWFSDAEAVSEGLADRILGQDAPQAAWDLSVYDRWRNADGNHAPMSGTHSHSHPAYGQGGGSMHGHEHSHDGDASHSHSHDPDNDGDDDTTAAGDTDHDYAGAMNRAASLWNAKYSADDRKRMAGNGHAMPDGSYPIEDEEDLDNAIHAVGRGGSDHDAIRRHIIKRAKALGKSGAIPGNWNADGSLNDSPGNLSEAEILALFAGELDQLDAGRKE